MGLLSKSAILGADDLKHEDVEVPQWGGSVRVRVMTGAERDEFRSSLAERDPDGKGLPTGEFSAALLASTCVDEQGNRLFTMDEVEALRAKGAAAIDKVAVVAMRLNGLGGNAVADAAKNSEAGQSADSGSGSPKNSAKA